MAKRTRILPAVLFLVVAGALAWAAVQFQPPAWTYLTTFVVIFLFYTNTLVERVPLYLSNRTTWAALAEVLRAEMPSVSGRRPAFVDLGCGIGGTVAHLARALPDWDVVGVETAPGPYLIAKARAAFLPNAEVRFQNLWRIDLAGFDVAYAFLSPAPMARLREKAECEMPAGALFLSNSFWADGAPYDGMIEVRDSRSTRLIFKRI